jgi:hypothetical protein
LFVSPRHRDVGDLVLLRMIKQTMSQRRDGMTQRYLGFGVPKSVGKGRVLMHNHVRHTIDMPCGLNGFRAWTDTKTPNREFKRCRCGWSGLPHYSRIPDYKCEPCSWAELAQGKDQQPNNNQWLG